MSAQLQKRWPISGVIKRPAADMKGRDALPGKQQDRAEIRMKKYGEQYQPHAALLGQKTTCEKIVVLPATEKDYKQRLVELEDWRKGETLPPAEHTTTAMYYLLDYTDAQFFSGLSHSDASKTWAAMNHLMPDVQRYPNLCKRIHSATQGFGKRAPAESRDAPPEEAWMAIIGWMLAHNYFLEALGELVRYISYMRPGEGDSMLVNQLVAPSKPHLPWGILLAPTEGLKPGKTGEYDESLLLDRPGFEWLHKHLSALVNMRDPNQPLWFDDSITVTGRAFSEAITGLGLDHLNLVRYSSRHSSASADLLEKRRTIEQVRGRLRHRSLNSVNRYAKAARVQRFANSFPPNVLTYGEAVRTHLQILFEGSHRLAPPGLM